jgi:hypothetical protein
MRKATTVQKVGFPAPDVQSKVVPVPTDGWDAISPLASMDPKRAPILNNWIPRPGWVELRGGYFPWVFLAENTTPVETLLVRRAQGGEQMFAAVGSKIYDVSNTGAPVLAVSGFNSARWQWTNFTPALGTTVIQLVNGTDTLRQYNGSVWSAPVITGLPGGLTTAAITNIHAQKRRLWYVLGNGVGGGSTVAAFMPTDAIAGAIAGTLDLGANWNKGGYLVAIADWTVDGGNGPQDFMVFISSRGQISIFSGVDPTDASTWTLAGTFDISPPVSLRCFTKLGSDVAIITQQGVLPLSQALPFEPSAERSVAITARIQNAMALATTLGMDLFGWQLIAYAPQQVILLNVPQVEGVTQVQYVSNALTGAWCQFTGWNANCFEVYNEQLFWGGNDGSINKAFAGGSDFSQPILADMQCAYNYFDAPGRSKRMTMVQPFISAGETITPFISIDTDFQIQSQSVPITILNGGALWDVAIWDSSVWFGSIIQTTQWLSAQAIGHALAVHLTVNIAGTNTGSAPSIFDFSFFDEALFDVSIDPTSPLLQINAFNTIIEMGGFI